MLICLQQSKTIPEARGWGQEVWEWVGENVYQFYPNSKCNLMVGECWSGFWGGKNKVYYSSSAIPTMFLNLQALRKRR